MTELLNNLTEWYQSNLGSKGLTIYVKIGFFILLFLGLFLIIRAGQKKGVLENVKRRRKTEKTNIVKGEHRRFVRDYFGNGFIPQALDDIYKYSRIYATSKIKTSIGYFRLTCILSVGIAIAMLFSFGLTSALASFLGVAVLMYLYLELVRIKNNREVASDMILFINLLSNYSTGNTEIMGTFLIVAPKMKKTLRMCLIECAAQGSNSGTVEALENLGRKIENKKFREVLKALVIAQKYSGGFTEAINQLRRDMNEHMVSQRQIKALVATNLASMGVCVGALLLAIVMVGNVIGENSLGLMFTTTVGRICATVMGVAILWFTKKMLEVEA